MDLYALINFNKPLIDDKHFLIYLSFLKAEKKTRNKEGLQELSDFHTFTYIVFVLDLIYKPLIMVIIFLWELSNFFTSKPRFDTVLDQCQVKYCVFLTNVVLF